MRDSKVSPRKPLRLAALSTCSYEIAGIETKNKRVASFIRSSTSPNRAYALAKTASGQSAEWGPTVILHGNNPQDRIHGCHHGYSHDLGGWHRHDKDCQRLRGVVRRKSKSQERS